MKSIQYYRYVIGITLIAAITGLLMGFDTGIVSGALQFIVRTFHISQSEHFLQEIIVSAVPIGALIGAILSRFSAHLAGRRNTLIITATLFIIGTLLTMAANSVYFVIIGRLVMGFAVGLSSMAAPMYLSEISPYQIRGAIIFLFQLAVSIGLMMAFLINYIFAQHGNWRAMFGIGLIPSVLLAVGVLFLPKSPRWLLLMGREREAIVSLKKLRQNDNIIHEINDIKESVAHKPLRFVELLSGKFLPVVVITFLLFAFQQLTGINTIFYYAPTVFNQAGFAGDSGAILASVSTGLIFVIGTVVGVWLVDIAGRRKLLITGCIAMAICLTVVAMNYLHMFGLHSQWIALIIMLVYIFFFSISMGGIPYVMMSELFPIHARSSGMALANCANWGFNILVSITFLSLINLFGISFTFITYAALTFIAFLFVYFFVPETKEVTLESIENNLYAGKSSRYLGKN